MSSHQHIQIEKIIELSDEYRSFVLDRHFDTLPGQFCMVWIPGFDEKPFSFSDSNELTVKKVGPFTEELFNISKKNHLQIRGPYGSSFPNNTRTVVGGGCGIAPLKFVVNKYLEIKNIILGGKNKSDLLFLDFFENEIGSELTTFTEDGSHGLKGIVTDIDYFGKPNYAVCGPEKMIQAVGNKINLPNKTFVSLERYMKCAVGLCGACSMSGYRVCVDGPVLRYDLIKDSSHFGKLHRVKSGELKSLDYLCD
ncbi:dihydroorotate dehydrogenase electron transfer subunit [Candidatus Woesearchaeota archaeon]|jgi:dihydroorotate dehydrogenase electron transfer subunit|nr:dihydroorotate dehydrogenase electron transfer subunit [Candidatus Woesearchaeota archaeon]MBT6519281.1 dihydroorotate dehydrogenase electron transfer subunit [Candidatus Woesearchaeota archaeon]MBT7368473.1 dihydroorotate dehydrogenase electron transfer subunit [Candidatus Woesearchaeota archaeon]